MQHLPCDLTRFRQVDNRAGNVLNGRDCGHGRTRFQVLFRIVGVERCSDDARSYGVESNMLFRVLHCQASRGGVQTTFSDHRNGSVFASNWIIYQRGADAHDAAAAFLRLHLFDCELRDVNEAGEVGRNKRTKVVSGVFRERLH